MTARARHDALQRLVRPMIEDQHERLLANACLDDGRICRMNNAAERCNAGFAAGRRRWAKQ